MSRDIEGLVETSTNLAAVKMIEGDKIRITTSQRSSVESRKNDVAGQVEAHFQLQCRSQPQRRLSRMGTQYGVYHHEAFR